MFEDSGGKWKMAAIIKKEEKVQYDIFSPRVFICPVGAIVNISNCQGSDPHTLKISDQATNIEHVELYL